MMWDEWGDKIVPDEALRVITCFIPHKLQVSIYCNQGFVDYFSHSPIKRI